MAKRGLGKGLDALITSGDAGALSGGRDGVIELRITDIEPNKNQPRKAFDDEKLDMLAQSIKDYGVLQPIVVKKLENGFYRLIAGERRWRAARKAGLKSVPAIVREYDDRETMEIALIENLQREDLNPIEEAAGYQELIDVFQLTQEELARKMGRSRPAIANALRLLNLPEQIRQMVVKGELSAGHARALLGAEDLKIQLKAAQIVVSDKLNVRQTEKLIRKLETQKQKEEQVQPADEMGRYVKTLESKIGTSLGTKVHIRHNNNKGKIEIEYYSSEDLERILEHIK